MDAVIVATPLRRGVVSKPYTFLDGVTIRNIHPILWERSFAKEDMSGKELNQLSDATYWLSVSKLADEEYPDQLNADLDEKARRAMNALQIIYPSGGLNVYLKFHETPDGFDNIGGLHPAAMTTTPMGGLAVLDEQGLRDDFDKVFEGVNKVFDEKIVRLENPILLLEHGLQANHVYLGTLMWVMGLDMLFMAGNRATFVDRAAGFLGTDRRVFPPLQGFPQPQQPGLTVGEVLGNAYELRNIIAHAREIPAKFREKFDLFDTNGNKIDAFDYRYSQVIMESALFLLARSLRKIMVDGLVDVVKDERAWKLKVKADARAEHLNNKVK